MPEPSVEPMPFDLTELRPAAPLEAQEAITGDGDIQVAPGGFQAAAAEVLQNAGNPGTQADGAVREDVGELHRPALEAFGLRVGNVVADDIQLLGSGVDAAQCL